MKQYDLMILGPATRDVNIDYTGQEDRNIGGAVTFCTPAARAAGAKVFAAVKAAPQDADILSALPGDPADAALLPAEHTTLMRNRYFTADRERRQSDCPVRSGPVLPGEVPQVPCRLYHLAGLLYGDFPKELIEDLRGRGMLSADAQGFLRRRAEDGSMELYDWPEKRAYLPYMDFFKTDAAEAEVLTGLTDRADAARQLCEWGANEVVVSYNTEILACNGADLCTVPIKARNFSGRTGRGDTTFGAYLAMRLLGADMAQALLYATACVSLKMETPGIFTGSRTDVEDYIRMFYNQAT